MNRLHLISLVCGAILATLIAFPSMSLAQRPDHPDTPTEEPSSSKGEPVEIREGGINGYVLNYSNNNAPEAGITVILDGGGWQSESVTNSEGYYEFAGLGAGSATLSLQLPAGAAEVAPNWPVAVDGSTGQSLNLGFYWGENPPVPVKLSVEPAALSVSTSGDIELAVTVNNKSGGDATNAVIDVQLPTTIDAQTAETNIGRAEIADHRVWGNLGELPANQTATLTVKARFTGNTLPADANASVALTYDQQLTPQLLQLTLTPVEAEAKQTAKTASDTAQADSQTNAKSTATEEAPIADGESDTLIPDTGGENYFASGTLPTLILSLLFIIGLGAAGFRAFAKKV